MKGGLMGDDDYRREIAGFRIPLEDLPYFIEMPGFRARWERLRLAENALHVLQMSLAARPTAGVVVAGTNGIRKLRFSSLDEKTGKSGAYRVFYLNLVEYDAVILMSILSKTEEGNLTKAQRNALAAQVGRLRAGLEGGGRA